MALIEGLNQFAGELDKSGIAFGIIGGLAVFAYGGERTTFDVDFLIHGRDKAAVKHIGEMLNLKTINENSEVLQLSGPIQIDIVFANRPQAQAMLGRLRKAGQFPFPLVCPEDLIGLKIQAFAGDRSREFTDKGDILTLFRKIPDLDFTKIKEYADMFNVWNEIEEIKRRV
jgi:hypothetical protein